MSVNQHKPLLRIQYKEHFSQKDKFTNDERRDLEKLELALQYLKELNQTKRLTLESCESKIKEKIDEKTVTIGEQYKLHL